MELEEGQIIQCTVDSISGTSVFVKIEDEVEAILTTSEIAPGRIRNLRDYVVPGKKIVCKIIRIKENRIYLSLRRVKQHERKELLEKIEKDRSYRAILKTVLDKENAEKIIEKITEEQNLIDFFEKTKKDTKTLNEYFNKEQTEKIIKILESKKEKPKQIKQLLKLSSKAEDGIKVIKKIIEESCNKSNCDISYIAAGKYRLGIQGEDFKKIKTEINTVLENMEKLAKKQDCEFSIEK